MVQQCQAPFTESPSLVNRQPPAGLLSLLQASRKNKAFLQVPVPQLGHRPSLSMRPPTVVLAPSYAAVSMPLACWGLGFPTWRMERSCRTPRKAVRRVTWV